MAYGQDITNCLADNIGEGGLSRDELQGYFAPLTHAISDVKAAYEKGHLPLLRLPEARDDLEEMRPVAKHFRSFKDVVILGTGGSSLGGRALYEMAEGEEFNGVAVPKLHIVTNVDPYSWEGLWRNLDPKSTGVIVISKSGGTAETLMQFLCILPRFRDILGDGALKDYITLITEPGQNPLRSLADEFNLPVLDHDPNVGGRYSVLSVVGMLPTMITGLDAEAVRDGAYAVLHKAMKNGDLEAIDPAVGAALAVGLNRKRNVTSSVMLAYSDRLGSLARWYRQLWAESLGKDGQGTTPIYGTGPVDQHSQLQLWLDGPADKMFTVLGGPIAAGGAPVDPQIARSLGLDYMAGRTMGDLMNASRTATTETLAQHGKPVRSISMDAIDERSMGALMMHFMLETILSAHLMEVDPFDQPAVEHGKVLLRKYMADLG